MQLEKLEKELTALPIETKSIDDLLDQGINNLLNIDQRFEKSGIGDQRKIIGLMYPEKLSFDGFLVQTTRVNEAASLIYSLGAISKKIKKDKMKKISLCPVR